MQRWSIGQSRSMQGRQNTRAVRTSWSPSGRVARSSVGPKIATTGRPSAAARCIAPESLETNDGHAFDDADERARGSSGRRGRRRAARMSGACARSQDSIARAASRSCAAPTITDSRTVLAARDARSPRPCDRGGHCLAWPYAAPGAKPTSGASAGDPMLTAAAPSARSTLGWRGAMRGGVPSSHVDAEPRTRSR